MKDKIEKKKQEEQVEVANQDSNDQDAKEEIQLARNSGYCIFWICKTR